MSDTHTSHNPFVRAINFLSNLFGLLSAAGIILATLIITEGVIVRYVFRSPTIWQVEMAIYLLMLATFLGSPYALKEGAHINIDLVISHFSQKTNTYLNLFTSVVAMLFCVLLAWKGWIMWYEAYEGGWVSESLWSVPLVYPYLIIPLGMTLTSLQYLVRIGRQVQQLKGNDLNQILPNEE